MAHKEQGVGNGGCKEPLVYAMHSAYIGYKIFKPAVIIINAATSGVGHSSCLTVTQQPCTIICDRKQRGVLYTARPQRALG